MREYSGLSGLRSVSSNGIFCPKCGNYLEVTQNGFFHGELFYCPNENKVMAVQLKEVKTSKEFLEQAKLFSDLDKIRNKINKKNYKEIVKLLDNANNK